MSHQLTFTQLLHYDAGAPGITLDASLRVNGSPINCSTKIDTGATFCLFERSIGEALGLDIESGLRRTVGTVTGTFIVYLHEVNLSIPGFELEVLAGFAEDAAFQRNVLGRRGFLEQVILGLVDYEGKLFLSRYGDE